MRRSQCLVFFLLFAFVNSVLAESLTVMQFISRKEKWPEWSRKRTQLTISGRYEGRVAKQFRLEKFPALITPQRTTVLPADVSGGQRLSVTGVLRVSGTRLSFDASRIASGATDLARLDARTTRIDRKKPDEIYQLAEEFEPIAEFYKDQDLVIRLGQLRQEAFQLQRTQSSNDPAALLKLAEQAKASGKDRQLVQALQFESLACRKEASGDARTKLLSDIRNTLKGWDVRNPFPSLAEEREFLQDMVAEYEAANELNRQRMHRRFYRLIRLNDILAQLNTDGSNGKEVAAIIATELSEEREEILRLNTMYVDYRLKQVPTLTRGQLEDVDKLLQEAGRGKEFDATLDSWLRAQEKLLNNGQPDGMRRMAAEYLFAFERWKKQNHKEAGTELLKQVWVSINEAAPREAEVIEKRLEQLGWQRMHDKWMTTTQVDSLPRNDVELALRENRAVEGMKRDQILLVMGKPNRKVKVASARNIQEIWIFGEQGSTIITVHMQRGRLEKPGDAVAILVSRAAY